MKIYTVMIIEFAPSVESGEFACVGVVLYSLYDGCLEWRLCEPADFARIKNRVVAFFPGTESVFTESVEYLRQELARAKRQLDSGCELPCAKGMISTLCIPRENVIRFGQPRVVQCEDPTTELEKQYKSIVLDSLSAGAAS